MIKEFGLAIHCREENSNEVILYNKLLGLGDFVVANYLVLFS
jgi:hypothetical protein